MKVQRPVSNDVDGGNSLETVRIYLYTLKDNSKVTEQYSKSGELLATFPSARAASKATGVRYKRISATITGRQKTAGGFIWKISEDMV